MDISDLKQAYERSIFRLLDALDYLALELEYKDHDRVQTFELEDYRK